MEISITTSEEYNLDKLSLYLNYELSSSVLWVLWYTQGLTMMLAIGAAVIFIPYMLYIFYEEKKAKWFFGFCISVVFPAVGLAIWSFGTDYFSAAVLIPIVFFYGYCGVLKYLVNKRLNKIREPGYFEDERLLHKRLLKKAKEKLS